MSKSAGKKPEEKSDKTKVDNFVWTDDEVQLLLEVTNDYKVSKAAKNIDWESCQSKYTGILELYREHYPSSQEESAEIEKEYPHKKEEITKVILTSKLKNIRLKFRQVIDSGKRSGHGRIVLLYSLLSRLHLRRFTRVKVLVVVDNNLERFSLLLL